MKTLKKKKKKSGVLGEIFRLFKHCRPKQTCLEPGSTCPTLETSGLGLPENRSFTFSFLCLTYEFWAEEVLIKHQKEELDLFNLLALTVPE